MRRNEFWAQIGPKNEEIGLIGHSLRKMVPSAGTAPASLGYQPSILLLN